MKNFLTIGQLCKIFKITPRAVRFYEEIGLIVPASANSETNYRYYSKENVSHLKKILYLKELGLSLEEIKLYFSHSNKDKAELLKFRKEQYEILTKLIDKLLNDKDYSLEKIDVLNLTGSNVQKKEIKKLQGVWKLSGIYSGIKNAKKQQNPLNKFSPYQFLAFDKNGQSPWFYYANDKKIVFNTFYKPISEIYQIYENKLFIKINNPSQHNFCLVNEDERLTESHILVFTKFSDNYEDYKQFLFLDENDNISTNETVLGTWELVGHNSSFTAKNFSKDKNSESVLFINSCGIAKYFEDSKLTQFAVCSNCLYNKDLSTMCKFKIENDYLILEYKTRVYTFTGKLKNYLVFKKSM